MSYNFSNTDTRFAATDTKRQEQYIREIVQSQVFLIFEDIKFQIETKIKSIDKSILELRSEVKKIYEQQKFAQLNELTQKIQKIQAEMQVLKYHQQNTLNVSRTKSLGKERKPIFKKEETNYDFSSIVCGYQGQLPAKSDKRVMEKRQMGPKPPLPKQPRIVKPDNDFKVENVKMLDAKTLPRSPLFDQSSSIHRWLNQNNNRSSSRISSMIKEEDMEESVSYR